MTERRGRLCLKTPRTEFYSVKRKRNRGDLLQTFKIAKGAKDIETIEFVPIFGTGENGLKLQSGYC